MVITLTKEVTSFNLNEPREELVNYAVKLEPSYVLSERIKSPIPKIFAIKILNPKIIFIYIHKKYTRTP